MHAIGLFHMQSRPDRDDYVQIHFDNIQDGKEHNFNKCESCLTYDVPYDAKSFMHYKYYYFAKDSSKPTISSLVSSISIKKLRSLIKGFFFVHRVMISLPKNWELLLY